MSIIKQDYGSIGASSLKKVGTKSVTPTNATSVTFDLSDLQGSSDFVLFENMIPVMTAITAGGSTCSTITITYTWTYDASTKKLTYTLGGNAGYQWLSIYGGTCTVDIYAL